MSTAVAFLELKRLLTGIESTSQRLKAEIKDVKSSKPFVSVESDEFVDGLENKVRSVQVRLDAMESNICGAVENRLSQVTMMEILQKCKTLHNANDEMIQVAERRMAAYGYSPISVSVYPNFGGQLDDVVSVAQVTEGMRNAILQPRDQESRIAQDLSIENDDIAEGAVDQTNQTLELSDISVAAHVNTENDSYMSPAATRTPLARGSEHEIKTPALPDWKLSEATRMLVKGDGKDASRALPIIQNTSTPIHNQNTSRSDYMMQTPDALDITTTSMAQTGHYPNVSLFASNTDHADESGMLTPQPVKSAIYKSDVPMSADSPPTPNIGTPFHTTNLREMVTTAQCSTPGSVADTGGGIFCALSENPTSEDSVIAAPRSRVEASVYAPSLGSSADSPMMTTPSLPRERMQSTEGAHTLDISTSTTAEDVTLQPVSLQLSPKMTFLAPRPASTVTEARPTLIPIVTDEEWESAPSFLRKQVRHKQYSCKALLILISQNGRFYVINAALFDRPNN